MHLKVVQVYDQLFAITPFSIAISGHCSYCRMSVIAALAAIGRHVRHSSTESKARHTLMSDSHCSMVQFQDMTHSSLSNHTGNAACLSKPQAPLSTSMQSAAWVMRCSVLCGSSFAVTPWVHRTLHSNTRNYGSGMKMLNG